MVEVMRWIAISVSLFSLGFSSYALWMAARQNKRLICKNQTLLIENAELRKLCDSYLRELIQLRGEACRDEESELQETVEAAD